MARKPQQDDGVERALAGANAIHDAMQGVCEAVADTLEGLGVKECVSHPTVVQKVAFARLLEEIRQRGRIGA